ncbi:hypothetical protein BUL40_08350 [Croceivirga radicis]|uniref:Glucose/Sorbosone dehydrogenase domain-containing protein n=1 Tax=Croceivirga radicis TaxID=1929488 RepID=A0A1V6LSC7_9FLAO|nr:PQQ-dependent sugar dehydrogenase [Croceivirga radicis]OQD43090.1 hypothetical protein BUL40_08350 [Croceivirga radicis]
MKRYSLQWISFLILLLGLFGFKVIFNGPGLTEAEPIGKYLNGAFFGTEITNHPYDVAFNHLTFNSPLNFNIVPNQSKIVVGQRDGLVYWFENQEQTTQKELVIDLTQEVGVVWDGGFLGLAIHPKFGTEGYNYFFVYYTTKSADNTLEGPLGFSCGLERFHGNYLKLDRFEVNPNTLSYIPNTKESLFKIRMYNTTHRGGGMEFGNDGFLYLSTGDQAAYKNAQDITNNLDGGVLRLDVDMNALKSHIPRRTMPDDVGNADEFTGRHYYIPNDNPFLDISGENFEEYYSIGHRNPHRMTKDTQTGKFYIGEVGESSFEEINVLDSGKNYGWPLFEAFSGPKTSCVPSLLNNMPHETPLVAFNRSQANAIIGGYVYRGSSIPSLYGKYICADYGNGEEIWAVDIQTGSFELLGNFLPENIISFGQDSAGELYFLKQGNNVKLYKLKSSTPDYNNIPTTLSEVGAFSDLETLTPIEGLIPFKLIDDFWSDGASKRRWMAIPNNGNHDTANEQIQFSELGAWSFPTGSVLIKHFDYPVNENNPQITQKMETRFSVKGEDGSFYFYTYRWNEAGTEAYLEQSGFDREIRITTKNGTTKTVNWHYPDNSECLTCHNSNSGGTLGTRTRYLNTTYDYSSKGGEIGNQLVTLSALGILNEVIDDTKADTYLTHTSIDNPTASTADKARSYLDLNCAYCHQPGTGNRGDFDLQSFLDLNQTNLLQAGVNTPLNIANDEAILKSGQPNKSILFHRLNSLDENTMMPPLAKSQLDAKGLALIEKWITELDGTVPTVPALHYRINASGPMVLATDGGPDWQAGAGGGAQDMGGYQVSSGRLGGNNSNVSYANRDVSIPSWMSAATYEGLFRNERWDDGIAPELSYDFPLPNGTYQVNLYMGNWCSCTSEVGERVFDVSMEGGVVHSKVDLVALFGHRSGGMLGHRVTVSDGELNLEFLHVTENPLVNAIEIYSLDTVPTPFPDPLQVSAVPDQLSKEGDAVSLRLSATGGDPASGITFAASGLPTGLAMQSTTGIISGTLSNQGSIGGPQMDGLHTVVVTVTRGTETVQTEFEWRVTELDGTVPTIPALHYRINASGPMVLATDGGPDWQAGAGGGAQDMGGYQVSSGRLGGNNSNVSYANRDVSIPSWMSAATYEGLFRNERWDDGIAPELSYDFPLPNGTYQVNLYMGNWCSCTSEVGERVFDVSMEGGVVHSKVDLVALFGHRSGGMLGHRVTVSDGELNLEFLHVTENPLVNAIEIKAIDNDTGIMLKSKVVLEEKEEAIQSLSVFPNPLALGGQLNVRLPQEITNRTIYFDLFSAAGQLVNTGNLHKTYKNNYTTILRTGLGSGIHILVLKLQDGTVLGTKHLLLR